MKVTMTPEAEEILLRRGGIGAIDFIPPVA